MIQASSAMEQLQALNEIQANLARLSASMPKLDESMLGGAAAVSSGGGSGSSGGRRSGGGAKGAKGTQATRGERVRQRGPKTTKVPPQGWRVVRDDDY